MKPVVLVVDDEERMRRLLRLYLGQEFEICEAATGREALNAMRERKHDLVVLDVMLPDLDGWEVCRRIRLQHELPVIMLTARADVDDRVHGLDLGADDYLVKPFDPRELLARIKAVLRRSEGAQAGPETLKPHEKLLIDLTARRVFVAGQAIQLTPKEFDLLVFLARHPNQAFSRDQLLEHVWGIEFAGETRTVDAHVKNVREKLGDESLRALIGTVWGVGYRFEAPRD
ncbi:MAG TPA: response regulator transcription factor [Limnochordia bacterium]|nr:response regulator transcription factor [Limnochordia bacterium]